MIDVLKAASKDAHFTAISLKNASLSLVSPLADDVASDEAAGRAGQDSGHGGNSVAS